MDETLVDTTPELDAPIEDTTLDTTDTDVSGSESADVDTSAEPVAEETDPQAEPVKDEPAINGTKLSAKAKQTLDELHKTDPKLARELKDALYQREAWKQAIPGGIKAYKEIQAQLETVGGFEKIQTLQAEAKEWEALDAQFTAGDPAFVQNIAETSPEAFFKIAPAVFSKFSEVSPDGYSQYIGQVFVADMVANQIPLALERLQDFIADNPKAQGVWKQLADYVNRINGFAQKKVEAPKAKVETPTVDADRQKFEQERTEFTRQQWSTSAHDSHTKTFNDAWTKASNGLKLTSEQTAAVKELYGLRLQAAIKASPDFNKTVEAYFRAGDKEGYLRFISSFYKNNTAKAIQSALNSVAPGKKPGPKPGQTATTQAVKPATSTATPGFKFVGSMPKGSTIDWTATSRAMLTKGQAVLADGTKVQWKR